MAKKIQEKSETAKPQAEQEVGVVFVKNQTGEIIVLPGGKQFKFTSPRQLITDPELIEGLKAVAKKYCIIPLDK